MHLLLTLIHNEYPTNLDIEVSFIGILIFSTMGATAQEEADLSSDRKTIL